MILADVQSACTCSPYFNDNRIQIVSFCDMIPELLVNYRFSSCQKLYKQSTCTMTRLCNSISTKVFYIVFKEFKDKFYDKNSQSPESCNVDGSLWLPSLTSPLLLGYEIRA